MPRSKPLLFVGLGLATGFIWGQIFTKNTSSLFNRISKHPFAPRAKIVTVDIVKEGDEIFIYLSRFPTKRRDLRDEHYTGDLVFEYNKDKEVDKTAYREFEDVWEETFSLLRKSEKFGAEYKRLFWYS